MLKLGYDGNNLVAYMDDPEKSGLQLLRAKQF